MPMKTVRYRMRKLELFVRTANRGIRNERYRPRVFVRPPGSDGSVSILPTPRHRRLRVLRPGRYTLYDDRGFRVADVNSGRASVIVGLPGVSQRRFVLVKGGANGESASSFTVPTSSGTTDISSVVGPRPTMSRGAEAVVFSNLFTYPFPPSDDPAVWVNHRTEDLVTPYDFVHGPIAAVGVQSGHLDSLDVIPTAWLGYRLAWDRISLDVIADLGLSSEVGRPGQRYRFTRAGLLVGPRYEWLINAWSIATGPVVGAAWEQQLPIEGSQRLQAASGFWSWRLGTSWHASNSVQLGLEAYGGGRVLRVDDDSTHRMVGGVGLSLFWIP